MKRLLLLVLTVWMSIQVQAQFNTSVSVQDASCWNTNDGSYTIEQIQGCFAPLTLSIDSTSYTFSQLQNNGYAFINQGAGPGTDISYSVWAGSTSAGPIYITTGIFSDSITFDDSLTIYATGLQDMFVACFDATTSEVMWAKSGGTSGDYTAGYGVAGAGDKAYVTGYFNGSCNIGGTAITSSGSYQGFVAKFDLPTGDVDTIIQVGGAGIDEGFNIHYAAGRIYLVGDYQGSITLAGNSYTSAGNSDAFILVLDTTLATQYWSAAGGGTAFDVFTDVVAYDNAGTVEKVFVTGEFQGTVNFGGNTLSSSGAEDFYVISIDTNGNFGWATQGGSTAADFCTTIDISPNGDKLYAGGRWTGSMIFGGQLYTSAVNYDGFIGYLDTAGTLDTVYVLSGNGPDRIFDLRCSGEDYLVFTGDYAGDLSYADSTFSSNGNYDAFVGQIGPGMNEVWMKNLGGGQNDAFNSVNIGPDDRLHCAGAFRADCSAYQSGLIAQTNQDVLVTNEALCGIADTTIMVSGLFGGSYTYTLTDSAGNTWVDTIVVGAPDSLDVTAVIIDASGSSANNGSIDITVSGGTPGYSFVWSNGATTEDIDSLMTGTYCVTIIDSIGCEDSICFFVDSTFVPSPLSVVAVITDLTCFGDSTGSIDLTVTGGIPPYSYSWSNGATTEDLTGVNGGTYTVTISDNDTATFIDSFVVDSPDEILISGVITPPTNGTSNDGAIDITVTGGTTPYSFAWSNAATSEDISGLGIGNYSVTITDTTGCIGTQSFFVDTIVGLSLVSTSTDVTCINSNNGAIDLTVVGGVPPFTFNWSNGATSEDISGLAVGVYTVTVTDSAAQTATLTDSIGSNPIHPDPVVGPISGPASVQAFTSYNYNVPITSGSAFDWTISGGLINTAASNAASVQWNAGPNGTLYVTETDINGCIGSDSLEVTIIFVGVAENNALAIQVYPNPAREYLNIVLPEGIAQAQIRLYDLQGRILIDDVTSFGQGKLRTDDLASGSYILHIGLEAITLTHTVVIQ